MITVMPKKRLPPEILEYFKRQGAKGGKIGGAVRAAKMTPARRREIALKAARSRWDKASD